MSISKKTGKIRDYQVSTGGLNDPKSIKAVSPDSVVILPKRIKGQMLHGDFHGKFPAKHVYYMPEPGEFAAYNSEGQEWAKKILRKVDWAHKKMQDGK